MDVRNGADLHHGARRGNQGRRSQSGREKATGDASSCDALRAVSRQVSVASSRTVEAWSAWPR